MNIKLIKSKLIVTPEIEVAIADTIVGIKQIAEMSPVLVGSGIGQQRTGHEIIFGSNHIGKMRVIR